MTSIARFDPFELEPLDDMFRGFFRPVRMESVPQMQIRMDVAEDDKSYTVHAEMPGVKKDDIHVGIDGNQVSISAEVKREKDLKEGGKVLRSERYFGKLARSFTLASEIDENAAQAKFNDGILLLTLPKKAAAAAKKIVIQ